MMTTIEHPEELELMAYLDRELSTPAMARVRGHLAGCSRCQAKVSTWKGVFAAIESELAATERVSLRDPVMSSLKRSRIATRRVRILLVVEAASSLGLLGILLGALRQLAIALVEQIEPLVTQSDLAALWDQTVAWLWQSATLSLQAAESVKGGMKPPPVDVPLGWWPWLAALALACILGNRLLLTNGAGRIFRPAAREGE